MNKLALTLLTFLLLGAGCQNPVPTASASKKTSQLQVTVAGAQGRSILPSDMSMAYYRLTAQGPGTVNPPDAANGTFLLNDLEPGTWTITVQGFDSTDNVALEGTKDVTITAGQSAAVTMALSLKTAGVGAVTGVGNLKLNLSWTVTGTTIDQFDGSLVSEANGFTVYLPFTLTGTTAICEKEGIPTGSYILTLTANRGGQKVARTVTDTVLIYGGKTSSAHIALTDSDFGPDCRIIYQANGGSGAVPVDPNRYLLGDLIKVLGNTGNLTKPNYVWAGWTEDHDSSGSLFRGGEYFSIAGILPPSLNFTAKWILPVVNFVSTGDHILMVASDGALYGWGDNTQGQLGDGTRTSKKVPVKLSLENAATLDGYGWGYRSYLSSEYGSSFVIKSDHSLWVTGTNNSGQLGLGTSSATPTTTWTNMLPGVSVASVTTCTNCTFIVTTGGDLYATGLNSSGQLGTGDKVNVTTPVQIMKGTAVAAVFSNGVTTFILTTAGDLYATGVNTSGQLGCGTTTNVVSPVQVMAGKPIAKVFTKSTTTLFLTTAGDLYVTGANASGQLGTGNKVNVSTPVQVLQGNLVASVFTNGSSTIALCTSGKVFAFGVNSSGQLGTGNFTDVLTPVQILSGYSVSNAQIGGTSTFIITTGGDLLATGGNRYGQLGNGKSDMASVNTFTKVLTDVQSVQTNGYNTFALKTDGGLWCCGSNFYGEIGNGTGGNGAGAANQNNFLQVVF